MYTKSQQKVRNTNTSAVAKKATRGSKGVAYDEFQKHSTARESDVFVYIDIFR